MTVLQKPIDKTLLRRARGAAAMPLDQFFHVLTHVEPPAFIEKCLSDEAHQKETERSRGQQRKTTCQSNVANTTKPSMVGRVRGGEAQNAQENRVNRSIARYKAFLVHNAASRFSEKASTIKQLLRDRLSGDVYGTWFASMELESCMDGIVHASVPMRFVRSWIQTHYSEILLACCQTEFHGAVSVEIKVQQDSSPQRPGAKNGSRLIVDNSGHRRCEELHGSPLDPRYTFESFIVGSANELARMIAFDTVSAVVDRRLFRNPLFIRGAKGLGKTHLLHAMAWEAKRRNSDMRALYLNAERFRQYFIASLRRQEPLEFLNAAGSVEILLIDDLEFVHGGQTTEALHHIVELTRSGACQLVVASRLGPSDLMQFNQSLQEQLASGVMVELRGFDHDLRQRILNYRFESRRAFDRNFVVQRKALEILAKGLTGHGHELDHAIRRVLWLPRVGKPLTTKIAEQIIGQALEEIEPRTIRVAEVLKHVALHFNIGEMDVVSRSRHRAIGRARDIVIYLVRQLTVKTLAEIGRRMGGRDHATVFRAIRRVSLSMRQNPQLERDVEVLKNKIRYGAALEGERERGSSHTAHGAATLLGALPRSGWGEPRINLVESECAQGRVGKRVVSFGREQNHGAVAACGQGAVQVGVVSEIRGSALEVEIFEIAGSIKWFDASKGYGFIVPDNGLADVLLHVTCLRAGGYQTAREGARVLCQVLKRPRGLQAFRILGMDESTAIHPSQLPHRTHWVVSAESGWERAECKWFNRVRGFGFLRRELGEPDVFVHLETLRRFGFTALRPGDILEVKWGRGSKGCMAAELRPVRQLMERAEES
jgi:chromosomal replication initiator protein